MCLNLSTNNKNKDTINSIKKTAKSTITVYKILTKKGDKYFSPHKHFEYELGYHYYNEGPSKFKFEISHGYTKDYISIYDGLHAYTSLNTAKNMLYMAGNIIVKAIIPKGSEYFINKVDHEIVSDNLIITKQIMK